jgi:hypothetical protein
VTGPSTATSSVETAPACATLSTRHGPLPDDAPLTGAELVPLRIRVIALENLIIALRAEAPDRPRAPVRGMATCISPRAGLARHPVALRAADEMPSLVGRADRYSHPSPP